MDLQNIKDTERANTLPQSIGMDSAKSIAALFTFRSLLKRI
jgi:hypothetical protein